VDAASAGFSFIYDVSAKRIHFICEDIAFLQLLSVASSLIFAPKSDAAEGDRFSVKKYRM